VTFSLSQIAPFWIGLRLMSGADLHEADLYEADL
jgi:hypothetical protein